MWILPKNYPLSSHYVADMVASSEDLSLLDTIIDSSLFVRSKPMSKSSLLRKWKRDTWFQRLCGQILKPSQHRSFETKLMSCLQVIPANRSAKLGNGGGKMIHDTCGPTSRNTLEQYDLFDVSLRTCKDTSRWDSPQSSQIWKNWVIEQRGEYSQRKKLALRIKEKECLSWPTPEAWTVQKYSLQKDGQEKTQRSKNLTAMALNGELSQPDQDKTSMNGKNQESSNWLTPRVLEVDESYENYQQRMVNSKNPKNIGKKRPSNLTMQVKLQDNWPTPRASNPGSRPNGKGGKILAEEVQKQESSNWPTPTAAEGSKIGGQANYGQVGLSNQPSIVGSVTREKGIKSGKEKNWPTPNVSDIYCANVPHDIGRNYLRSEVLDDYKKSSGKLNPDWCEQLMGLPVGWTKIDDADDRISRLMAIGNGVVPQTAALAWVTLSEKIKQ